MCLVLIACKVHPEYPLVIAANRDEYYRRPTVAAAFWADHPEILGGRDLLHGGTWLALDRRGRVAAVTNYREPSIANHNLRSRGFLVTEFLAGAMQPQSYLASVAAHVREYDGFNIFAGDASGLFCFGSYLSQPQPMPPGIHGISNGDLDYPWPKVTKGKQVLDRIIGAGNGIETGALFNILMDRTVPSNRELRDSGAVISPERMLAPIFITSEEYGTRSSTVVLINAAGEVRFAEQSYGIGGELQNTVEYEFKIET